MREGILYKTQSTGTCTIIFETEIVLRDLLNFKSSFITAKALKGVVRYLLWLSKNLAVDLRNPIFELAQI